MGILTQQACFLTSQHSTQRVLFKKTIHGSFSGSVKDMVCKFPWVLSENWARNLSCPNGSVLSRTLIDYQVAKCI